MTPAHLQDMTTGELVSHFVNLALGQDEALLDDQIAVYNRLYKKIEEVCVELRARPGDQRRALMPLFEHANAQVRLKAAIAVFALAPEAARRVLQNLIDRQEYPQRAYAWDILEGIECGRFVPT